MGSAEGSSQLHQSILFEALHRRLLALSETIAFLPNNDLSRLSRTSRSLCYLSRSSLFREVAPCSVRSVKIFCDAIRGNNALGIHVRMLEVQFQVESIVSQCDLEHSLVQSLPLIPRLERLHWFLGCKPFADNFWSSIQTHCPFLNTIDILTLNGIKPNSVFFNLANLRELRIRSWTSDFEPSSRRMFCLRPLPEETFRPNDHPLSKMLRRYENNGLTVLELNIEPAYAPALSSLLTAHWPQLRELILSPIGFTTMDFPTSQDRHPYSVIDLPAISRMLIAFLVAHPMLQILRLDYGRHMLGTPRTVSGLHTEHCAVACSLLTDPRLPDTALPNLHTFEGVSIADVLVVCSPTAARPLVSLPRLEGCLQGLRREDVPSLIGIEHVDIASSDSRLPATDPDLIKVDLVDVKALSHALGSKVTLERVALRFHDTMLGKTELCMLAQSLPNVKHLFVKATSVCRSVNEVLQAFSPLTQLLSLALDYSFTFDKSPREFADLLARVCPRIKYFTVLRCDQTGADESYQIRWAKVRKERDGDG